MRFLDRLAGLSTPIAPGARRDAIELERRVARLPLDERRAEPVRERSHEPFRELDDADRTARIERLRALIGEVETRTRPQAGSMGGNASSGGTASALRGDTVLSGGRGRGHVRGELPFGASHTTAHGTFHSITRSLEPQHQHGRVVVRDALTAEAALVARLALDPAFADVDLSRMLILDTETTGLAGGAGTVPFLIGMAWFEDGALRVEQLFLREFGGEAPLLHRLAEQLARASCIVSYNGKSFDWPLLRARFVLNRVPLPAAPPHLDLLHCVRRVWKPRMQSARLCEVERTLLGFYRDDDIDGALIPGLYLAYLRGADPRTLLPIFTHNEQDMVALAAILSCMCAHFSSVQAKDDPRDHLAYARVALRAGDLERAQAFADAAAAGSETAELAAHALGVCATVARRRGDSVAAAQCLLRALDVTACENCASRTHLTLARLYERQLKDLPRAYHHARFASASESAEANGRRLGRLARRLQRMAQGGEAL